MEDELAEPAFICSKIFSRCFSEVNDPMAINPKL